MPVSAALAYEIFYIEFWHILSLLLILSVNYYIALKASETPLLYTYFTAQAMLVVWIVSKIFKTVSPTIGLRWFFIVTQYFGVSFLGPALLVFAWVYAKKKMPAVWQILLMSIPAAYSFMVVLTNPLHYRMYATFSFYKDTFGDLFYINMAISYLYTAAAVLTLSRGFLRMFGRERTRAVLFAAGILFPFVINLFYTTGLFKTLFGYTPLFDYTPIATNYSLILFTLAAFRYRFLDMLPMAERQIFNGIGNAVAITNKRGIILRQNTGLTKMYPEACQGGPLPEGLTAADGMHITAGPANYKVSVKQKKKVNIISLTDKTGILSMVNLAKTKNAELTQANRKLEEMLKKKRMLADLKTRNRILQELHDILGHSVVLAISLCEAEILSGAANYSDTLKKIKKMLMTGSKEFEGILKAQENPVQHTPLLNRLEELTANATTGGMATELIVQGAAYDTGPALSKAIYGLCREAVTNAVKHSGATSLSLIIRFNEESVEVFAIDNGCGCENIKNGKGLSGIIKSFGDAGGSVEIASDSGCGFYIHAKAGRLVDHYIRGEAGTG